MNDLKIAIVQTSLHWEDIQKNLLMFDEKLKNISDTDLIILPEMFNTGFTMNPNQLAENMDGKTINWMKEQANRKQCSILASMIVEENGNYYNRAIYVNKKLELEYYDKRHLFRMAGEHEVYSKGNTRKIVLLNSWRLNINICYDLRFPVWTRFKDDFDAIVYVANWPDKRIKHWQALLKARAIENLSYVVGVNRVGRDGNDFYYSGCSSVLDPKGDSIIEIADGKEAIKYVSLVKKELEDTRNRFGFLKDKDQFELTI